MIRNSGESGKLNGGLIHRDNAYKVGKEGRSIERPCTRTILFCVNSDPGKFMLVLLACLLLTTTALAQDPPGDQPISYDQIVTGTITDGAFFDWWRLEALQGDMIVIEMIGTEGLAPVVAILEPGGTAVANSPRDSQPNTTATLEFTVPVDGRYTILTTRAGDVNGTTTGSYVLTVRNAAVGASSSSSEYDEVVFLCQNVEVINALTLEFSDDNPEQAQYRISVYGLDGLQPVIRLNTIAPDGQNVADCSSDETTMAGDVGTLPETGETFTVAEGENPNVARLSLNVVGGMGTARLNIGSTQTGRYMVVIEGLSIGFAGDTDPLFVRPAPRALNTPVQVYMVRRANSRVDPLMSIALPDGVLTCDDAGRRDCADVPAFTDAGVSFSDGTALTGTRFDAGMQFTSGIEQGALIDLGSRANRTTGDYAVVVIGQLPGE